MNNDDKKVHICLEESCDKKHDQSYDKFFCSKECERRYDIKSDLEITQEEEVVCPYCKEAQTDIWDGGGYHEADGTEFDCQYCDKTFILTASNVYHFSSYLTETEVDKIIQEEDEDKCSRCGCEFDEYDCDEYNCEHPDYKECEICGHPLSAYDCDDDRCMHPHTIANEEGDE